MEDWESRARAMLPAGAFDMMAGGSGCEQTLRDNVEAWSRIRLRPRVLRDVSSLDTSVSVLTTSLAHPVLVAPVGYARLAHPDGEIAVARGAREAGSLFVLSTRSSTPIEVVAEALAGSPWWFQVYVLADRSRTVDFVQRAREAGCGALVLTADTPFPGSKPRNRRNGFALPPAVQLAGADPGAAQDRAVTPDDVSWLSELADGLPVVVKGVLRADDAQICLQAGAAGIVVSNHGGRQLDGAVASADALREVVEAVDGRAEVYVDGGIRSGTDVLRALALGARAVLVGRPCLWGLAAAGAAGVAEVLGRLVAELEECMALAGAPRLRDVTGDLVAR